ncbi:phosphotransferase [Candidatus Gracilibacteria bacterium]|nr:phosphotransferase [Candidatus Gracilibacteria bacterium]NJM85913.1 phosphotransferase [Hydrococcus sp. RU_2_2]NJP18754.1 phosphotransferase [Hydrococcus sp. CRU_1_1]
MINSTAELLTVARQHGFRLKAESIKLDKSGIDFLVAFATDEDDISWVFRIPRRSDVIERAVYENQILNLVRDRLPIAVPNWQLNASELIAYPRLPGTPAATINPEIKNYDWYIKPQSLSTTFVDSLAEAIAALHSIEPDEASKAGVRLIQPIEARQSLAQQMEKTKELLDISDLIWRKWQKWLADDTYWPKHSVFVHGDLHPGHILVDRSYRVTGLIDWTEAEVADPATDFTFYYSIFGASALSTFLQRYQKAGGRVWNRMEEHIAQLSCAFPVKIAMFVLHTGEDTYLELARMLLSSQEQQLTEQ